MRAIILGAVAVAYLAGPVYAQGDKDKNPLAVEEQQKKKEAEAVEKEYNATRKYRDQAPTPMRNDPWQNMRGADDSKTKR